jgi:glucose 1-dehydrogenase
MTCSQADLSSVINIRKLVFEGVQHFGKLDILVNNAGIDGKNADFWDITEADYDAVLNLNLKGTFFTTQAFVQHLIETRRTGKIINISSTHEEMAFPHFTSYCASKGGVKMMMRNLAVELGPLGITVNNIAPGAIKTPINAKLLNNPVKLNSLKQNIPLGRLGTPEDIAPMVAFLASSAADYITGSTFFVDGGLIRNYHEQ